MERGDGIRGGDDDGGLDSADGDFEVDGLAGDEVESDRGVGVKGCKGGAEGVRSC